MKNKFIFAFIFLSGFYFTSFSQSISGIINSYAAVSSISSTTLGLSTVAGFVAGDKVLLIQMQGAGINTGNSVSFGNLTSVGSAGEYEFNYIGAINGSSVTLTCPLINTYNTGGGVQLVKVPVYASATITNTLTCQAWNGSTGGVLAFQATTLTMNSDINTTGLGFRGGNFSSGGFCCVNNNFFTGVGTGGQKGEGSAQYTVGFDGSKGKNANGGGGANCGNSGGGGGGLGGAGGIGGNIYSGCGPGDQGVGGLNLPLTTNLLYMGGGAGGGFRDNGQTCTAGGPGGAIVFIISSQINGNSRVICTAGTDVTVNSVDEGAGGGGAGGSVYISCPSAGYVGNLTVDVHGGKGGGNFNVSFPTDCHGPGGGGGGGVYAYTGATMPGSVTFSNAGGVPGLVLNPSSSCFNTGWGALAGSPGISLNNLTIAVAIPTVSIAGTNTVCSGSAVTLTASGAGSYTWSTGAMTTTAAVTPTALTTYTVTGGLATCTNSATFSVTPVNIPTLTVAGNFSVCAGNPTTLTANGATTYTWSTGANSSSIAPSAAATTVYTVSGTASTCSSSATATITVTPSPTPGINSNSPVCIGNPINLNGSGGITYQWTGPAGSGFSSSLQNPSIAVSNMSYSGAFTLTVTDINNCSTSTTQALAVNALPVIGTTGSTICINQTINLSANGGASYSWSGPAGYSSAIQNPVIANASLAMAGIYTVTVTDANTCTNTAVANVSVNPIPTPTVQSNTPVCVKQILNLSAAGGTTYQWIGPAGFSSAAQNPTFAATGVPQSGTYSVTVSDAIGCSAIAAVNVIVNPLPSPVISSGPNKGCAPLCLTFTCASTSSIQTCAWDFGDGNGANTAVIKHCFRTPGIYTVTAGITDTNTCYNAATYTVDSYPVPTADFNFSPIRPILNEGPVNFSDASYGANISFWSWYFMNTATYQSTLQNPSFVYGEAGTYQVALTIKSDKGCRDTIIKTITISEDFGIFVPDAFTPNGDGLNDLFQAKGFGISKYDLEIYDRWGEKLFHTTDFTSGWNGTYNSKPVTEGVYVWKIKVTNIFGKSENLTGHVTLFK